MLKASVGLYADNMFIHQHMQDGCFHVLERLIRDGFIVYRLIAVSCESGPVIDISDGLNNDGRNTMVFELRKRSLFWKGKRIITVESVFRECNRAPKP